MAILRFPNLLPSGLTLAVDRDTVHREDARRFVTLFKQAWWQIPRDVRDVITRRPPPVLLTSELHYPTKCMKHAAAAWFPWQNAVGFSADKLRDLPDCGVQQLVGHEFCHCWLQRLESYEASADEDRVNALVKDWGFAVCAEHRAARDRLRGMAPAAR